MQGASGSQVRARRPSASSNASRSPARGRKAAAQAPDVRSRHGPATPATRRAPPLTIEPRSPSHASEPRSPGSSCNATCTAPASRQARSTTIQSGPCGPRWARRSPRRTPAASSASASASAFAASSTHVQAAPVAQASRLANPGGGASGRFRRSDTAAPVAQASRLANPGGGATGRFRRSDTAAPEARPSTIAGRSPLATTRS